MKAGPTLVSIGDLATLCDTFGVSGNDDEPYVVSKDFICNLDDTRKAFRFFVSTPRLLKLAENVDSIQADATYKLIWEGNR